MKNTQTKSTEIIIMKTMEAGFMALAKEQKIQKDKLNNLEQELKNEAQASYKAHTKDGKSRYILAKNKQGKSPKEISNLLNLTENYINQQIKNARRNGR